MFWVLAVVSGCHFVFCWVCRVGFLWGVGGGMMVIDQVI